MNRVAVAQELVKLAKSLQSAGVPSQFHKAQADAMKAFDAAKTAYEKALAISRRDPRFSEITKGMEQVAKTFSRIEADDTLAGSFAWIDQETTDGGVFSPEDFE